MARGANYILLIDDAAEAVGRDPSDIATVYNFPGVISPAPRAATRDTEGRWIGGSVEQWVEELTGAVLEHGASGFTLFGARGGTPSDAALATWAREIVPAVREAIDKG